MGTGTLLILFVDIVPRYTRSTTRYRPHSFDESQRVGRRREPVFAVVLEGSIPQSPSWHILLLTAGSEAWILRGTAGKDVVISACRVGDEDERMDMLVARWEVPSRREWGP